MTQSLPAGEHESWVLITFYLFTTIFCARFQYDQQIHWNSTRIPFWSCNSFLKFDVLKLHCCISILSSIIPPLLHHEKGVAWPWEFRVSFNLPLCLSHFSSPAVHLLPSPWFCMAYEDSITSSWWEDWVFITPSISVLVLTSHILLNRCPAGSRLAVANVQLVFIDKANVTNQTTAIDKYWQCMFKGTSLTSIKQLFLTLKEMLITVARLDLHLVCSDSEGWLENMDHAVFLFFYYQWLCTNLSILYFLYKACRRMYELWENEAQCGVSNLCFCNTNRNRRNRHKLLFLLFRCLHIKQDRVIVNVSEERITWLCHINVFSFQNWITRGSNVWSSLSGKGRMVAKIHISKSCLTSRKKKNCLLSNIRFHPADGYSW